MAKSKASDELRHQLVRTFENPNYRPPPLPSVASEIVALGNREDIDIEDIVRVLERDEMLAGAVVRLVNSPMYIGRGPIRSLREAVIRVGVRKVQDVVFEAALKGGVFNLPGYEETMERIRLHSTVTAYFTRVVCRHARINEGNAFLCGLLHDIGFAAVLFAVANGTGAKPPLAELWPQLDAVHEQASKLVTKLWGLPTDLSVIVGHHHQVHTGATSRVAAVVAIADNLTEQFSAHIVGPPDPEGNSMPADSVAVLQVNDARSVLGLDDGLMARVVAEAGTVVSRLGLSTGP
jgi:HD-like signal output (HDOD) protein